MGQVYNHITSKLFFLRISSCVVCAFGFYIWFEAARNLDKHLESSIAVESKNESFHSLENLHMSKYIVNVAALNSVTRGYTIYKQVLGANGLTQDAQQMSWGDTIKGGLIWSKR